MVQYITYHLYQVLIWITFVCSNAFNFKIFQKYLLSQIILIFSIKPHSLICILFLASAPKVSRCVTSHDFVFASPDHIQSSQEHQNGSVALEKIQFWGGGLGQDWRQVRLVRKFVVVVHIVKHISYFITSHDLRLPPKRNDFVGNLLRVVAFHHHSFLLGGCYCCYSSANSRLLPWKRFSLGAFFAFLT